MVAKTRFASLSSNGWLTFTPVDFRQAVLERLTMRKLSAGEAVYRTDDTEGGLWGIVEGGVLIEMPGPQLTPGLAYVAAPGFWFGETPLIFKSARKFDAYAAQPSIFATVSLADCRTILEEDPRRWQWIALLANMNSRVILGLMADVLLPEPQQRVIAALLRISGLATNLPLLSSPGPLHVTQHLLGRICNLSRTAVSGILRDLERKGLIRIGYRSLEVLDSDGLKAMLGTD